MKIYEAKSEGLPDVIRQLFSTEKIFSKKKIKYYNSACGFDTESSSFEKDGAPLACLYVWQLGLCNKMIIIGRTWEEYESTMQMLQDVLGLGSDKRLIIYVHNLAWDFQFIQHHHSWTQIFAPEERAVCYAVTDSGFEFRCSYFLTNDNLANVAKNLHSHDLKKLSGDLDYNLIRHSGTPLTADEIEYCIADVKIVMALIEEKIAEEGKLAKIPLTKTGYARRFCRSRCMAKMSNGARGNGKWIRYRQMIEGLPITVRQYYLLKWGFQGGFVHASARYSTRTQHNARGKDVCSDYPAHICFELYPMSKFFERMPQDEKEFRRMLEFYACLFKVTVYCIDEKITADHPISVSRCMSVSDDAIIDNGRLVSAGWATFVCTEIDWKIYERFYDIKAYELEEFYISYKGYLPKDFILAVLSLYNDKTALKGVKGSENEYRLAKETLNSCYGMMVEDPVRDEITLDNGEWIRTPADVEKKIEHYNKKMSRFTYYPWGIWVTAYAREQTLDAVAELGGDYLYSDTDSVKYLNPDDHEEYFEKYNQMITEKSRKAAETLGIDFELYHPKTKEGIPKPLGHWETDADLMPSFKSLGAKRYLYTDRSGELHLTCAGLDKDAAEYIKNEPDPFEFFSNGMHIPPEYSGRKIHTYIDYEIKGEITDYLGNPGEYHELSSINLRPSDYNLTLSAAYADFILGLVWKETYD